MFAFILVNLYLTLLIINRKYEIAIGSETIPPDLNRAVEREHVDRYRDLEISQLLHIEMELIFCI